MNNIPGRDPPAPAGGAEPVGEGVFALLDAARSVQGRLERTLEGVGLSIAKYEALDRLARAGTPITLGELADRLGCVRSNVTQLVDRLEADGLVRRAGDPADRRTIRAMLTPLGAERHAAAAAALGALQTELVGRVTPEEGAAFRRVLEAIR